MDSCVHHIAALRALGTAAGTHVICHVGVSFLVYRFLFEKAQPLFQLTTMTMCSGRR